MLAINTPPSSVSFPSSDPSPKHIQPALHPHTPYLPFRRISLPTAPTLLHRESVVSVASFDSMPEGGAPPTGSNPAVTRNVNSGRKTKRPTSIDGPKRNRRKDVSVKPVDQARESKRRKVIAEFYETERAYVDGLELIYSLFLTPIIASLDSPQPLLDRGSLTSVFSNFIDIWNLHRSFFSSLSILLSAHMSPSTTSTSLVSNPPPLSPILLSHFPYLSLYTPFVTSFPSTISSLINLITPSSANALNPHYSPSFALFLSTQEADPRCGRLKLRDWLLSIVQRCPRYLLLLKDLINCTAPEDPEHTQLTAVHALVSKITLSLNTSLHTHAQTLSLLALQRSTPNLPFQLIIPGRTLLKRGPLLQVERSAQPREREFLLFSDCVIWLASEESERGWGIGRGGRGGANGTNDNSREAQTPTSSPPVSRPMMARSRSKSEAELAVLRARTAANNPSPSDPPPKPTAKSALPPPKSSYHHPTSNMMKRHASSTNAGAAGEERWVYKGRAELVDVEVIVSPPREIGEERRFEVLSPEGSFVLYAATEDERNEWSSEIRQAKAQLLVSFGITHPNSTLTSSSSTKHLRRSLQALPFPPSDERLVTVDRKNPKGKGKKGELRERRGRVEHWVPAIWIPDEKTQECMRCGRSFGWRRRRHHCRLCGRCVCASCSGKTFFISDPNSKDKSSKPARACNACYETVFPLLDSPTEYPEPNEMSNTINSLSNFPSWLTVPAFPLGSTPQALMAIDSEASRRERELQRIDDQDIYLDDPDFGFGEMRERVRLKSQTRPRSYHQILEDFEDREQQQLYIGSPLREGGGEGSGSDHLEPPREGSNHRKPPREDSPASSKRHTMNLSSTPPLQREDTARRNKRFSLPAVALQTTSVTARTQQVGGGEGEGGGGEGGAVRAKRFSLVLGRSHSGEGAQNESVGKQGKGDEDGERKGKGDLGKGVAAGKLSELLGRKKR